MEKNTKLLPDTKNPSSLPVIAALWEICKNCVLTKYIGEMRPKLPEFRCNLDFTHAAASLE